MDTFDIILIIVLGIVIIVNVCNRLVNPRRRFRSELLEGSNGNETQQKIDITKITTDNIDLNVLNNNQLKAQPAPSAPSAPVTPAPSAPVTPAPVIHATQAAPVTHAIVGVGGHGQRRAAPSAPSAASAAPSAPSAQAAPSAPSSDTGLLVSNLWNSMYRDDLDMSKVSGIFDDTILNFRQVNVMDDVRPMPLARPYQQQVFNQIDDKGSAGSAGSAGGDNVEVHMVWADWCGYSKKAMEAWPQVKDTIGNNHMGVSIVWKDILEKENKELIKQQYAGLKGFPTLYMRGNISGTKVDAEFNAVDVKTMLGKIKGLIQKHKSGGGQLVEGAKIGGSGDNGLCSGDNGLLATQGDGGVQRGQEFIRNDETYATF
jgi:thiol-disulfide isomerase/thioredoxin